jgi:hypothetical protein
MVLSLFGVLWIMSRNILELLHCWKNQGHRYSKYSIWKVIPSFLMWNIWRERNCCYFEDCDPCSFFKIHFSKISLRLDCSLCSSVLLFESFRPSKLNRFEPSLRSLFVYISCMRLVPVFLFNKIVTYILKKKSPGSSI